MNRKLKILSLAARWLFVLCVSFVLLTASIGCVANSLWFYEYEFEKHGVGATTGLAEPELEKAARGMTSYYNSGEEHINITVEKDGKSFALFNQREIVHMKDVKGLIRLDYWVLLGTFIYTLGYALTCLLWRRRKYWQNLAQGTVWGCGITLAIMLALGVGTLLGFDRLFLQFHLISFANDFWLLDPTRDYLIMLFPRGFWYEATLLCALGTAVAAVVLGGVGGGYLYFTRKKT
ncbi:TIGR01906 family membrane protein [Chloroflexota bacterium]